MRAISRCLAAVAVAVAVAAAVGAGASAHGSKPPSLQFLGQAIVPTGTTFAGTTVGGLSSITYDKKRGVFYSLSDDQSQFNPARFYTLRIDLSDGQPRQRRRPLHRRHDAARAGRAAVRAVQPRPGRADADEERRADRDVRGDRAPAASRRSCAATRSTGRSSATCRCRPRSCRRARRTACARTSRSRRPRSRRTAGTSSSGWRARSPRTGPPRRSRTGARRASSATTSRSGRLERQNVYFTDPIAEPPVPATQFAVNGLVELLPFNDEFMLSMERSFSVGAPGTGQHDQALLGRVPRARRT